MKVGVLSDTHLTKTAGMVGKLQQKVKNTYTLEELHDRLSQHFHGVDLIVHAGDLVHLAVIDMLKEFAPVEAVHGNMDTADVCAALPEQRMLECEGKKIGLIHGSGGPQGIIDRVRLAFQGQPLQAIIFGHTHQPVNSWQDGLFFFNPGSPTDRIFAPYNSVGVLEISEQIAGRIIRL